MHYIYCYENKINHHKYVGQTNNLKVRYSAHESQSGNPNSKDYNCLFHKKIREYGLSNFDFYVLEEIDSDDGDYVLPRPLKTGDRVFVKTLGSEAEVISVDEKKNTVQVQSGMIKMKADISDIRLIGAKKEPKRQTSGMRTVHTGSSNATASSNSSVDLRGTTVEEAMLDLDKFIDGILRTGLNQITIIHGKGTGALRKGIHVYLRKHPNIRTFRVGTFGEGEE